MKSHPRNLVIWEVVERQVSLCNSIHVLSSKRKKKQHNTWEMAEGQFDNIV